MADDKPMKFEPAPAVVKPAGAPLTKGDNLAAIACTQAGITDAQHLVNLQIGACQIDMGREAMIGGLRTFEGKDGKTNKIVSTAENGSMSFERQGDSDNWTLTEKRPNQSDFTATVSNVKASADGKTLDWDEEGGVQKGGRHLTLGPDSFREEFPPGSQAKAITTDAHGKTFDYFPGSPVAQVREDDTPGKKPELTYFPNKDFQGIGFLPTKKRADGGIEVGSGIGDRDGQPTKTGGLGMRVEPDGTVNMIFSDGLRYQMTAKFNKAQMDRLRNMPFLGLEEKDLKNRVMTPLTPHTN